MREMKLRLEDILEDMRAPEERKNLNNRTNIRWLMNNLPLANANHQSLDEAIYLTKTLAKKLRC